MIDFSKPRINAEITRSFDLSDILSITTSKLVSTRQMDGVKDIMRYLTGDPEISTNGLTMMHKAAIEIILQQYPALAKVVFPNIQHIASEQRGKFIHDWLAEQRALFGNSLRLSPTAVPLHVSLQEEADYVKNKNPDAILGSGIKSKPTTPVRKPRKNPNDKSTP